MASALAFVALSVALRLPRGCSAKLLERNEVDLHTHVHTRMCMSLSVPEVAAIFDLIALEVARDRDARDFNLKLIRDDMFSKSYDILYDSDFNLKIVRDETFIYIIR